MKTIEYFYACYSVFAYLGAGRLAEIAAQTEAKVVHRPFDLAPVMAATGSVPFGSRSKAHRAYFFGREITRWAEVRNLEWIKRRPTHHDNPLDLGHGAIIAAQIAGMDVDALSRALLQAHWRDDADPADPAMITSVARALGMDAEALLAAARSDDVQQQHRDNTAAAIDLHVFGSPTYFVDGDMFYGQDRLELVARALERPFSS